MNKFLFQLLTISGRFQSRQGAFINYNTARRPNFIVEPENSGVTNGCSLQTNVMLSPIQSRFHRKILRDLIHKRPPNLSIYHCLYNKSIDHSYSSGQITIKFELSGRTRHVFLGRF